ncbi:flagellar hook-basal body complex protein FliE [Maricaulis sp.]|uniref:flagellar hook-basal body complex protein FliE n=1 Tax=Maricaulis sp. TaxID=1486257 RepID=UPI00261083E9|nr:flagellar hook-basal body complex protein FliE [Maricaulis sp.]
MAADLSALQAYQAAARAAQQVTPGGDSAAAGSANIDFGGLVTDAVASTQETLAGAEAMTQASLTGQADLIDVATAVSAAEITLETVVAVRDEVVKAYQEILRMPI